MTSQTPPAAVRALARSAKATPAPQPRASGVLRPRRRRPLKARNRGRFWAPERTRRALRTTARRLRTPLATPAAKQVRRIPSRLRGPTQMLTAKRTRLQEAGAPPGPEARLSSRFRARRRRRPASSALGSPPGGPSRDPRLSGAAGRLESSVSTSVFRRKPESSRGPAALGCRHPAPPASKASGFRARKPGSARRRVDLVSCRFRGRRRRPLRRPKSKITALERPLKGAPGAPGPRRRRPGKTAGRCAGRARAPSASALCPDQVTLLLLLLLLS